jgi:hypothetical protein
VELGFTHRAFEPEQQAVIKMAGIVHAVLVEDEGVRQCADFQQPMPIGVIACQP